MNKENFNVIRVAICIAAISMCMTDTVSAQRISTAAQSFQTEAVGVKEAVKTGLMAIAFICAAIGAVGALSKSNVDGEQASKSFVKWFVAAGLFGIAWAAMATIFV